MTNLPPLPTTWPTFDLGDPASRRVKTLEGALDGIKTVRGISMFIVVFGLIVVFFYTSAKVERMVKEGQVVQATVDDKYESRGDDDKTYRIEYLYRFGGYPYTGRLSVGRDRYEATAVGEKFPITILPSDPDVHEIGTVGEADVQTARRDGSLVVLAIALPFALIALYLRAQIRNERKILSTWFTLPAQVLEVTKTTSEGNDSFTLHYRVPLPNGRVVTNKASITEIQARDTVPGAFFPVLAPPDEVYIQERLRTLSSITTVQLESEESVGIPTRR